MKPSAEQLEALPPPAAVDTASKELVHNLLDLWRIVRHKRTTIIRSLCVAVIIGSAYYALAPRYYESAAKLLIVQRQNDELPSMSEQAALDNTMATHQELVTSPVVVQAAIEQLIPEHRIDFVDQRPQFWIRALTKHLSARTSRRTNIIEVSYQSLDSEAAAAVVSAVIQSYLQFVDETHQGSASEVIQLLTRERDQLSQNLALKQRELQKFRQQRGQLAIKSGGQQVDPMIQRALRLNDALMTAQEARLDSQATLATVEVAVKSSASLSDHLAAIEKVMGKEMLASALGYSPQDLMMVHDQEGKLLEAQAQLQSIAPYYGQSHPRVRELNEKIRATTAFLAQYRSQAGERATSLSKSQLGPTLITMLQQQVAEARQKEQQLLDSFNVARADAARQSGEIVQLEMLEREVERLEKLHDVLFDKIAAVDMRQLQGPIQATVVQEPLPNDLPVSPQLRHVAVMCLFGGLLIGGVLAYVQDVLEDRFASPEDITRQLGVPVLALVRRLEPLVGEGLQGVHMFRMPTAVETETFRTLRTALTLQTDSTDRILVSSAEPSDGKTTVTVNLAVSFAQAGKRTLVIDADLRKPGFTARLNLRGLPGVADLLTADGSVSEMAETLVHATELAGLDALPAGLRRPNPAELLGSDRFAELLSWADSRYDQVIVDCPPVLAVSDAQIVGRLIDGAILVVRPEKNHRRLVIKACENFLATGSRVLGIVANGLSVQSHGYGYGYGYGDGYGEQADESPGAESTTSQNNASENEIDDSVDDEEVARHLLSHPQAALRTPLERAA